MQKIGLLYIKVITLYQEEQIDGKKNNFISGTVPKASLIMYHYFRYST